MEGIRKIFNKLSEQIRIDGSEYRVKVYTGDSHLYSRTFGTRSKAREFKSLMKDSTPIVECHIIKRVWDDGFILSEEEVW